jgi:hypothetical protein
MISPSVSTLMAQAPLTSDTTTTGQAIHTPITTHLSTTLDTKGMMVLYLNYYVESYKLHGKP